MRLNKKLRESGRDCRMKLRNRDSAKEPKFRKNSCRNRSKNIKERDWMKLNDKVLKLSMKLNGRLKRLQWLNSFKISPKSKLWSRINMMLSLRNPLKINLLDWTESIKEVSMNSKNNHGMTTVSTKDPLLLLLKLKMEGYLEDILHKAGLIRKVIIISILKMIRHGYFRLTIPHNSR